MATNAKVTKTDGPEMNVDNQKALEDIDVCQTELDKLHEKASEEILQVERKFNALRKPHFQKRSDLIAKIPGFWQSCFMNHPQINCLIGPQDEEVLRYLTRIDVEEQEDIKSGFKLKFFFAPNHFFENSVLTKDYKLLSLAMYMSDTGEPKSECDPIKWKPGANYLDNGNSKNKSGSKRAVDDSPNGFFTWYMDNEDVSGDDISELIKDELWPNPLQYYLQEDVDENGDDYMSDEEEDDEDYEGEEVVDEDGEGEENGDGEGEAEEDDDDDGDGE